MKKLTLSILATAAITLSGCATQTYTLAPSSNATPTVDTAQDFFIYGIGQEKTIDAAQACNGAENIAKVQTQLTFFNALLGNITFGLYTPRQARVFCK